MESLAGYVAIHGQPVLHGISDAFVKSHHLDAVLCRDDLGSQGYHRCAFARAGNSLDHEVLGRRGFAPSENGLLVFGWIFHMLPSKDCTVTREKLCDTAMRISSRGHISGGFSSWIYCKA